MVDVGEGLVLRVVDDERVVRGGVVDAEFFDGGARLFRPRVRWRRRRSGVEDSEERRVGGGVGGGRGS